VVLLINIDCDTANKFVSSLNVFSLSGTEAKQSPASKKVVIMPMAFSLKNPINEKCLYFAKWISCISQNPNNAKMM
jgi:hypothetical protein